MEQTIKKNKTKGTFSPGKVIDLVAQKRWLIPLTLIVVYVIAFAVLYPSVFLTKYNLASLLLEFSIPAFVIIGMAIQLINGEIDLSVGYVVMFSNVCVACLIVLGVPVWGAIAITVLFCALIGWLVGVLVAGVGVNSFIATLGSGMAFYGLGLMVFDYGYKYGTNNSNPNGLDLLHLPDSFKNIAQLQIGGFQLPVYYALAVIAVFVVLMSKSKYFKQYYYIGMNKEAAELSGIRVKRTKIAAFVISATLSSLAGVLLVARMGSGATTLGVGMELKAITAVVIGGVSFKGGRGTMIGAVFGGLFVYCVNNALRITNAPSNLYKVIEGLILLCAVILDAQFSKRKIVG